jgi:predicted ester cyclase
MTTTEHDYTARARQAIEIVCSGDLSRMSEFYAPDFVDHVNDMTFYGYDGGRESLAFYMALIGNLEMGVEEQVTEGNRVASRWVLHGDYRGRAVTLRGITLTQFGEDGRARVDWGHSDSISFLRQIGALRVFVLAIEVLTRRVKLPKGAVAA